VPVTQEEVEEPYNNDFATSNSERDLRRSPAHQLNVCILGSGVAHCVLDIGDDRI
jgi:hypothetical protein